MAKSVSVEKKAGIAWVTLDRADARNAFNPEMIAELRAAFESDLNKDASLRAVILRGAGESFCAGADVAWMRSMANYSFEENRKDADALYAMFLALRACPAPLIARVQGHAMGGALGLISVCDMAFTEENAKFAFSEVRLGIAPAVISPFALEKMERGAAARFMLTGEVFTAAQAKASGLVTDVAPDLVRLDERVAKTIGDLSRCGLEAVRATKALLRAPGGLADRADLREFATRTIAERRASAEGQEGLRAFLEKREPSWRVKAKQEGLA